MSAELRKLFDELAQADLLEDRREYTVEDLQSAYGLSADDAQSLYAMIQKYFAAPGG